MKAILIDDERHALLQLQWMLDKEPDIEVAGAYQNAAEGLAHLARERVEIAFLDMEMPGLNGLEAAEAIAALDEDILVVFVTAYSSYALDAFKVNALDYVLKPIDPLHFAKTLERIRKIAARTRSAYKQPRPPVRPEIGLLGQLAVQAPDGQRSIRWRTLKAKELFAYLVHHQGLWLAKDTLLEEVWPAFDLDKALVHLHTAVYQVRRVLRENELGARLDYSLESYRLHGEKLDSDADRFQQAAAAASEGRLAASEAAAAWELYRGHYLEKEDYPWAAPRRESLLQSYVGLTLQLAAGERTSGALDAALRRVRRACELHPYSERLMRERLACLAAANDAAALRASFAAFCRLTAEELGSEPSAEFQAYGRHLIEQSERS